MIASSPALSTGTAPSSTPLSPDQQRLWVLTRLAPSGSFFQVGLTLKGHGPLQIQALDEAGKSLLKRHEALRCRLVVTHDSVLQRTLEELPVSHFPVIDLSALSTPQREDQGRVGDGRKIVAEKLATTAIRQELNPVTGPPFRAVLLRLGKHRHHFVLVAHQLFVDAESLQIAAQDWVRLYGVRVDPGMEAPSPVAGFLDVVQEQHGLEGQRNPHLAFWLEKLNPLPPALSLPLDHPRPAIQGYRGGLRQKPLSAATVSALLAYSKERSQSVFQITCAAFQVLLARHAGQRDFAIGAQMQQSSRAPEAVVGPLSQPLILRTDDAGNSSFEALLKTFDRRLKLALTHHLPFSNLVEALHPETDLSRSPIFQVGFRLRPPQQSTTSRDGVTFEMSSAQPTAAHLDLELELNLADGPGPSPASTCWHYDVDLFDQTTIDRLAGAFELLLTPLLARPWRPIDEPSLLSLAERWQILGEWNDTATTFNGPFLLHRRIEAQVANTPGAVAVEADQEQLTYGQLNARAEILARRLRNLGVGPEVPVGVCLERSADLVVALLAVLKAGGAYLPLDPEYPRPRLAFMLSDSAAPLVITSSALASVLPPADQLKAALLRLDLPQETTPLAQPTPLLERPEPTPDNLAYIIYTSGSTGHPKGAMNSHRAVLNRLLWGQSTYRLTPEDRLLQKTPVSFDISAWELFWPLMVGARLVLARPAGHRDSSYLVGRIRSAGITTVHFVPSLLDLFLEAPGVEECHSLRRVLCSGEALRPELATRFFRRSRAELHNLYGPTEAAIEVTASQCRRNGETPIDIGRPIANLSTLIVDPRLRPVPRGSTGELLLGGRGVCRGYLGRPALTAESFVPDPLAGTAGRRTGARLYRTGDLARWRPRGTVDFLGRLDYQVKVRGFRIELGEIETALDRHPLVAKNVVTARTAAGGSRLIGYLVPTSSNPPPVDDLRQFLAGHLPDYMIPATFVVLDQLPLAPSGKVDRKSLPDPGSERPQLSAAYVAPRDELEATLAALWRPLLGVERIGVEDDFFDLGGHSLMATLLLARLRQTFRIELQMHALFSKPTVAALAEEISQELQREGGEAPPPLQPMPRGDRLALSFAQQRLWFLEQLEDLGPAYNVAINLHFNAEPPSPSRLESAIRTVEQRHEVLRTTFAVGEDDRPYQVISLQPRISLRLVDLDSLESAAAIREAHRLATVQAAQTFDLAHGPLMRATLLNLPRATEAFSTQDTQDSSEKICAILLLDRHHIICDDWSTDILLREVMEAYAAQSPDQPSPAPPLPVQYADYAIWQRRMLSGERLRRQLAYWRQSLAGLEGLLELPADHPRPARASYRGERQRITLDADLTRSLRAIGRGSSATLFMVTLAAFQTLLARLTGHRNLAVGVPVANRDRAELEGLIGFFVNTVVLRTELRDRMSFVELLAQTRERSLEALANQDLPLDRLVEELVPERSLGYSPLFQVMFTMASAPLPSLAAPGFEARPEELSTGTAKFDWLLALVEAEDEVTGILEYSTDLFDPTRIGRTLGQFKALLRSIVARPQRPLSELPLLSLGERAQLLLEWNDTADYQPQPSTLVELLSVAARRWPEEQAVMGPDPSCERDGYTYHQLATEANLLASYLVQLGVGPEVPVAVALDRTPLLPLAVLATFRAGGFCLPLDPTYPAPRLSFMLEDTASPLLLTTGKALKRLVSGNVPLPPAVLRLDDPAKPWRAPARILTRSLARPDGLAYTIYTSGSTGRPKGIVMPHRALVNLITWQRSVSSLGTGHRTLQFSPLSFDVSFQEFFTTWIAGGTLVLLSEETRRDPQELLTYLVERRVERIFLPFVALQALAMAAAPGSDGRRPPLPPLREIITAGEQLQRTAPLLSLLDALGDCRLVNQYGPSEAHVVTAWTAPEEPNRMPALPPIGRPVANTKLYLLQNRCSIAPLGVPGEVALSGEGLARGYRSRPSLTAQSFIPDFLSGHWGARLYLTGDLGRQQSDGELEFLGRTDRQVKVRGFRIEPGEIEAEARSHPAVAAVVVAVRSFGGQRQLVAYLVATEPFGSDEDLRSELRKYLTDRLPQQMVPQLFVILPSLPLTPTGKVDLDALPEPEWRRTDEAPRTAPRNSQERRLAAVWEEVLGIPEIDIDDNFFNLGGHSLMAAQVMSRIRGTLGIEAPLRILFEAPTVAELARALELDKTARNRAGDVSAPLEPVPRTTPLPLSFGQQRLWLVDQLLHGLPNHNLATFSYLRGTLHTAALQAALTAIAERHEVLRTTFPITDGAPHQRISFPRGWHLPVIDLSSLGAAAGDEELRLARRFDLFPFDLDSGPLTITLLLRRTPVHHLFLLNQHHAITDGASREIFFAELAALYRRVPESEGDLPPLPVQYGDFAVWQRHRMEQREAGDAALEFWRRRLARAPAELSIPRDRPRTKVPQMTGNSFPLHVSLHLDQRLRQIGRAQGATPFMVLLAAFAALLGRHSGQRSVALGTPVSLRDQPQLEGLQGFLINTLVLVLELGGNPSFSNLVEGAREETLLSHEHRDLPFEHLVAELRPERVAGRQPLFQALLQLEGAPPSAPTLEGLEVELLELSRQASNFDLYLLLFTTPEGIRGSLQYSTELFDSTTILRLLGHFQRLLEGVSAAPERPLASIPLLSSGERQQLITELADTMREADLHLLHAAFLRQAASHPERAAVAQFEVDRNETLTYGELEVESSHLAARLLSLGVKPEVTVGVFLNRTPRLVVTLLGILRAGGVFLPLDPTYPRERLVYMIEDSGTELVLTDSTLQPTAQAAAGTARVLILDEMCSADDSAPGSLPVPDGNNLAYMIYTSGSTGRPKGVSISHRAAANFLNAMALTKWFPGTTGEGDDKGMPMGAGDTLLAVTTLSFDIAILEIFLPLSVGARTVLVERDTATDGEALADALERTGATVLQATPATWRLLLESGWQGRPGLTALCGGEALPAELAQRLLPCCASLWNLYGPTETTVWSAAARVTEMPIRLGKAIDNTGLQVLDDRLAPVPVGVIGELYIAGQGLARGYRFRPALTAERFLPDPTGSVGGRLYRVGDLARRRASGGLEFLGRVDHQVKVRGFRIELGEIEAVLTEHPAVNSAVVEVREAAEGDPRLIAFITTDDGTLPAIDELRQQARRQLPPHAVPSAFLSLPQLPLTLSGKIDRKALPAWAPSTDPATSSGGAKQLTHQDPTQELLATLWAEALCITQVRGEDHFFELGGHSLLAARLLVRLRDAFEVELPLKWIFEHPQLSAMAAALRQSSQQGPRNRRPPLLPLPSVKTDAHPLSLYQQGLWLFEQRYPRLPVYNLPHTLELRGDLDMAALQGSLHHLTERHQVLLSCFHRRGQEAVASRITAPLQLPVVDLGGLAAKAEAEADLARQEAILPFDLQNGPLVRWLLLRRGAQHHQLLINLHHAISDAGSMEVLQRDLGTVYRQRSEPPSVALSELPPLALQYGQYARWQRSWLQGDLLADEVEYWRRSLDGAPEALDLPTDRPRPPVPSFRGELLQAPLPEELRESLKQLGHRAGVTLYMILMSGFTSLIYRISGKADLVVGTPLSNRGEAALEGLIGYFVNVLPLRLRLSGEEPFIGCLQEVRQAVLTLHDHGELPFHRLVEDLRPPHDPSRNPIFQVLFQLLHPSTPKSSWGPLEVTHSLRHTATAKFDLELSAVESEDGLSVGMEYNSDLFDSTTAQRFLARYQRLLEAVVTDSALPIAQIELLPPSERQQLLVEWNDTAATTGAVDSILDLITEQARRQPQAPAIVDQDRILSYGYLEAAANRLARHLRSLGAGPEVRVCLLLPRSSSLVLAALASLKAGASYLPLDPAYPDERLAFMLEEAGRQSPAQILVSQKALQSRYRAIRRQGEQLVLLEKSSGDKKIDDPGPPEGRILPSQLAYTIYTSGSTGQPKGTAVEHASLLNLVTWHQRRYRIVAQDRATLVAAPGFDASVWETWPYLASGAALHIPESDVRLQPASLVRWLVEQKIDFCFLPTPLAEAVLGEVWPSTAPLRQIHTGGDRLTRGTAPNSPFSLVNHYGPTENTVVATFSPVRGTEGGPPIGRPVDNVTVRVLDRRLSPSPLGVPGELVIGGSGLARGYAGRPRLTAEVFLPDPYGEAPGCRLYRTGDLVKTRSDGELQFLGRIDHQIKLRGFRIELGEIESVLKRHPLVEESIVLVRGSSPEHHKLVAFCAQRSDASPSDTEMRAFASQSLPEYMVPTVFIYLPSLPQTTNGKIDRQALQRYDIPEGVGGAASEPPANATEASVIAILGEVLQVSEVGATDNFFTLGGNSLLAVHVMTHLRQRFGLDLPVATLFQAPTARQLGQLVSAESDSSASALVLLNERRTDSLPFYCVHGMSGNVFRFVPLAQEMIGARTLFGLQGEARSGHSAYLTSVEAMAEHYLATLRRFQRKGPYLLGGYSVGGLIALEMARRLEKEGESVPLVAIISDPANEGSKPNLACALGIAVPSSELQGVPRRRRFAHMLDIGRQTGQLPVGFTADDARHYIRIYASTFTALHLYRAVANGSQAILFEPESHSPLRNSWSPLTATEPEIRTIPGTHASLLQPPHVQTLAQLLRTCLNEVEGKLENGEKQAALDSLAEAPPNLPPPSRGNALAETLYRMRRHLAAWHRRRSHRG